MSYLETRPYAPIRSGAAEPRALEPDSATLTPREQEVLGLMAQGYLHKQIARTLNITINTVEKHLCNIHEKFQTASSFQTVLVGITYGFLDLNTLMAPYDLALADQLSPAERRVLEAMVADHGSGGTGQHIAWTLVLSEATVDKHFGNIMRKLEVPGKMLAGLIYLAAKEQGIVSEDMRR